MMVEHIEEMDVIEVKLLQMNLVMNTIDIIEINLLNIIIIVMIEAVMETVRKPCSTSRPQS